MSFVKDRIGGIGRAARATFFGIIGIILTLAALGAFVMSIWGMFAVFFVAMWLTIKAVLWLMAAGALSCLGYGAFTLMGGRYNIRRRVRATTIDTTVPSEIDARYEGKWGNVTLMTERRK